MINNSILNKVLLSWNDSGFQDSGIIKASDIKENLIKVDVLEEPYCYSWHNTEGDLSPEQKITIRNIWGNNDAFIDDINYFITHIFKGKKNFDEYVKKLILENSDRVCSTDYDFLDTYGWNFWISDVINEIEIDKEYQKLADELVGEDDKYGFIWEEILYKIPWGFLWCLVEDNALDIELPIHPEDPSNLESDDKGWID